VPCPKELPPGCSLGPARSDDEVTPQVVVVELCKHTRGGGVLILEVPRSVRGITLLLGRVSVWVLLGACWIRR